MRFSVVIPTYQRRDIVVRIVAALERQQHPDFEVVVVVDGSTDGTAEALRRLELRCPLTLIQQTRRGSAAARNAGAAEASGELLLFLDDDMEADPSLLMEHERTHSDGRCLVIGDLPLHQESPRSVLTPGVERWAERRRRLLAATAGDVPLAYLQTGQMSIRRRDFEQLGGFDVAFTRDGTFGGEDIDFGYRATKAGLPIVFNPAAISYQYYDVDPATYTRRSREAARAALELSVKHPERADELMGPTRGFSTRRSQLVYSALAAAPAAFSWPIRALAVRLVRRAPPSPWSRTLFFDVQTMEQLRGRREARHQRQQTLATVLAYHAVSDLRGDPVLGEYGVPPESLAAHLDMLARRGWRFISLTALLQALGGSGALPRRAALVTFDDAYADLLSNGGPVLANRAIPAAVFAVTGRIGMSNEWDRSPGAAHLPLLDEKGLRAIAAHGIEVGSHGATHRKLVSLDPPQLELELRGSADRLQALGLPRPAAFSYPHGVWNADVAAAVQVAGYEAAFTVSPGVVRRWHNRYALPRIEVYASDTPRTLWVKLATARWPERSRRWLLRVLEAIGFAVPLDPRQQAMQGQRRSRDPSARPTTRVPPL